MPGGKQVLPGLVGEERGDIPAPREKTSSAAVQVQRRHPRAREKTHYCAYQQPARDIPALAGNPRRLHCRLVPAGDGDIPAHAGKPITTPTRMRWTKRHPRDAGQPRVRHLSEQRKRRHPRDRGATLLTRLGGYEQHPRVRGKTAVGFGVMQEMTATPPRTRGNRHGG